MPLANVVHAWSSQRVHHVHQKDIAVRENAGFSRFPQFFGTAMRAWHIAVSEKLRIGAIFRYSNVPCQPLTVRAVTHGLTHGR